MEEEAYRLRRTLKKLESIRGRHTELVSVYIPSGYSMILKINQLGEEAGTASNIKSKSVRTNVTTAIEKMITALRKIGKTPKNGLAIFSGNISEIEGKSNFEVFAIEPPEPIHVNLYRCDQVFVVKPLKELLEAKNTYGILVIELRDATIATLKGSSIVPVSDIESGVMGKFKAGGQSAGRFARIRENQIKHFMKTVAEKMEMSFKDKKIAGLIIGGPGPAKDDFVHNYLSKELRKKVLTIKDIGYTGEQGLRDLVNKSHDILAKEAIITEKKHVDEFLGHLAKDDGFSSYGEDEVWKKLSNGVVEKLLLSESTPEEIVEKFSEKAKEFGTELHLISEEFQEGVQLKELGGIVAILRYKV